jgi:serine/threonine protein kinase
MTILQKKFFQKKYGSLQIFMRTDYMHNQRVVHLDIKPNNIMFATALPADLRIGPFIEVYQYYNELRPLCDINIARRRGRI